MDGGSCRGHVHGGEGSPASWVQCLNLGDNVVARRQVVRRGNEHRVGDYGLSVGAFGAETVSAAVELAIEPLDDQVVLDDGWVRLGNLPADFGRAAIAGDGYCGHRDWLSSYAYKEGVGLGRVGLFAASAVSLHSEVEVTFTVSLDLNSVFEFLIGWKWDFNHVSVLDSLVPQKLVPDCGRDWGPLKVDLVRIVSGGLQSSASAQCVFHQDDVCLCGHTPSNSVLGLDLGNDGLSLG